jgi:STE24 endopeptidase
MDLADDYNGGMDADSPQIAAAGPAEDEVKRYQREKLTAKLTHLAVTAGFLAFFALWAGPRVDGVIRAWVGESDWLRLFGVLLACGGGAELLSLPIDFWSSYVVEHRYKLSTQSPWGWIDKHLRGWLVGALIGAPLLAGLFALLRFTEPWWAWATLGWLGATLLLGRLLVVWVLPFFYKITPLDDEALRTRFESLARGTGLCLEGVYRLHLSAETRKANAALAGLGKSRRVLLGDTLLEQFTPEEIGVVFAHEVGHHVHRHLRKMIVVGVALAVLGFFLADIVLRTLAVALGYEAFNDPAALPLVLLVLTALGLILAPAQNALSRFFERQCDLYALRATGTPAAYRSAFAKLATINKSDPKPHWLVVWLFYDHPPIRERIAVAEP